MKFIALHAIVFSLQLFADGAQYVLDPSWPAEPIPQWGEAPGVSVDSQDNVWVFQRSTEALQVFSNTGVKLALPVVDINTVKAHQIRLFGGPGKDSVWVVDQGKHVVERISGEAKLVLGQPGEPGDDHGHFNQPTDVAIGRDGDIYVSDGYVNSRVVQFDSSGKFKRSWGSKGSAAGQFRLPHAIVADSEGRLYVADRSNQRIQVFSPEGDFITQWKHLVPWGLWITGDDKIYACGSSTYDAAHPTIAEKAYAVFGMIGLPPRDQVVLMINTQGDVEQRIEVPEMRWVHGVALDSKQNLYLSDIQGHSVRRYIRK